MKNLLNLLEKFKNSLDKDILIKESIIKIIKEKTGGNLESNKIHFKEGVLELDAGAAFKNEIKLKEDSIKRDLKELGVSIARIIYK